MKLLCYLEAKEFFNNTLYIFIYNTIKNLVIKTLHLTGQTTIKTMAHSGNWSSGSGSGGSSSSTAQSRGLTAPPQEERLLVSCCSTIKLISLNDMNQSLLFVIVFLTFLGGCPCAAFI